MGVKKSLERFSIREKKNPGGTKAWQVTGTNSKGERIREQFKTKAEAQDRKHELEQSEEGIQSRTRMTMTTLSETELQDAEAAVELASGRSPLKLIQKYLDFERRALAKDTDYNTAVSFFETHYTPELVELNLHIAVERFLASREDRREKTKASYGTATNLLVRAYSDSPNTLVHQVTLQKLDQKLTAYKNSNTKRTYKRGWHTFFEWCLKRRHVLENPVKRMDNIESDQTQISILSIDEIKRLLTAAMLWKDGRFAPVIAIGIFAGLRPSEIEDLKPSDIKKDNILVTGGKLRRNHKRKAPIHPPLDKWLKAFPFVRYPAGAKKQLKVLKGAAQADNWVQDIIRHTSITFQLERDKDEAAVAYHNGTSKTMMDRHYRQIIETDEHVAEFWKLTPSKVKSLKLEVKLPNGEANIRWPDKKALSKLVKEKPVSHIAADLDISDQAVRKHCKKLGLELPPRGYWQKKRAGI